MHEEIHSFGSHDDMVVRNPWFKNRGHFIFS